MNLFDFIIVGAGSSGCALAYRLSENPDYQVLLIEAGPKDDNMFIHMPMGFKPLHQNPKYDWNYMPEPPSKQGPRGPWIRGKVLGGSSSLNGMVYVRGQPDDFDGWKALGNPGWGWDEILPVYQSMENHELGPDPLRGVGGPVDITCHPMPNPLCDAYIAAGAQAGLPLREDLNREDQVGIGYFQRTIANGRRVSSATAFLRRCIDRKNLTVVTDTCVRKVLLDGRRANGVECLQGASMHTYRAAKEVILAAGAIGSPQLLQVSGIGPGKLLSGLGIQIVQDLQGVGGNLQEHLNVPCVHSVTHGDLNGELSGVKLIGNLLKYAISKKGVMSMAAAQVGAFAKTRPGLERANAQWHMAPLRLEEKDPEKPGNKLGLSKIGGITSIGCVMHPAPGGDVRIVSPDALVHPTIRYEYLRSEEDRQATLEIMRFSRKIAQQPALAPFNLKEVAPGPALEDDDRMLEYALQNGVIGYHPVGTCKMGRDAMAVVDHTLKVHGIMGLRVADASIMPVITSGNTNAPCMMIGLKAGAMILAEHAN